MSKWSEFLVKPRIDDSVFALHEAVSKEDRQRIEEMQCWCQGVLTDKERAKKIREIKRAGRRGHVPESLRFEWPM